MISLWLMREIPADLHAKRREKADIAGIVAPHSSLHDRTLLEMMFACCATLFGTPSFSAILSVSWEQVASNPPRPMTLGKILVDPKAGLRWDMVALSVFGMNEPRGSLLLTDGAVE
jgi:hypothetical protein